MLNINPSNGAVSSSATTIQAPNTPAKLGFDRTGRHLYVAFDGAAASNLRLYSVNLNGNLTESVSSPYTATGVSSTDSHNVPTAYVNMDRFSALATDATREFLYVSSLFGIAGSDRFSINSFTGK